MAKMKMSLEDSWRKSTAGKRTSIGGARPKTASMKKSYTRSFKKYRGQGR
jgi:hypothetical protein